jgi:hypothetical protein
MKKKQIFNFISVAIVIVIATHTTLARTDYSVFTKLKNYFYGNKINPQSNYALEEMKEQDILKEQTEPKLNAINPPKQQEPTYQSNPTAIMLYDLSLCVLPQKGNTCGPHSIKNNNAILSYLSNNVDSEQIKYNILLASLGQKPTTCSEDLDVDQLYDLMPKEETRFLCVGNLGTDFGKITGKGPKEQHTTQALDFFSEKQQTALLDLIKAFKNNTYIVLALSLGKMKYFTQVQKKCDEKTCGHCPLLKIGTQGALKKCIHRTVIDSEGKAHENICCMCQTDYTQYGHWIGLVIKNNGNGTASYYYTNSLHGNAITENNRIYRSEMIEQLHNLLNIIAQEQNDSKLNFLISDTIELIPKIDVQETLSKQAFAQPSIQKISTNQSMNDAQLAHALEQEENDARLARELEQEEMDMQLAQSLEQKDADEQFARTLTEQQSTKERLAEKAIAYRQAAKILEQSPLDIALYEKNKEMVQYFIDNPDENTPL